MTVSVASDQNPVTRAFKLRFESCATNSPIIQATSNVPGSPYIPYALADKIGKADIFVGDITTVVRLGGYTGKSLPNANVTFELRVASAELGWSRIILLFNTALAELDELPFDFDRHRISKFRFSTNPTARKSHESDLRNLAQAAILQIVKDDPKRPRELLEMPPEQIKRLRDIENLRWFLQRIHTALLDEHILEMPTYLNYSAVVMFDGVDELQRRSDFLFYDPDLTATVNGIITALRTTLSHLGQYRETSNPFKQSFGRPGDLDLLVDKGQEQAFQELDAARRQLKIHLDELIAIVRERYIEVDIDETNRVFAKEWAEIRKSMREDEED
jgi:hypothetical protein